MWQTDSAPLHPSFFIGGLRAEVLKLHYNVDRLTESQVKQNHKLQTHLFKVARILQSQVNRRVENDISKAIKELSKALLPLKISLEQQRAQTEEVLHSHRFAAAIANLTLAGDIMGLFVGLFSNVCWILSADSQKP